ncbi:hypothetical protein LCGC14_2028770 [marine sediment metagenome]|uniref:Uncharacterized protein n=1 Tax=marine sediment metagenome TaxID=412755 RepID=A0A0F9EV82_9ZZZZ
MSEREFELVEVFKHRRRTCVVVRVNLMGIGVFHNGYAQVQPRHKGIDYNDLLDRITTDELTFSGELTFDHADIAGRGFVGFDTAHHHNRLYPETTTQERVRAKTVSLCNELIEKNI